jgi:hypothetical protein
MNSPIDTADELIYRPFQLLERTNLQARLELTKTLTREFGIRLAGQVGRFPDDARGLAFFFAFDPWKTSLRCPPGSVRFFSAAEKGNLISGEDAVRLASALIRFGQRVATEYKGPFSSYFSEPQVQTIFSHAENLDDLANTALAIGDDWVDTLFQACPFPLHPNKHLQMRVFQQLESNEELEFYSQSKWLSWTEALDLVCLGSWAGLKPDSILTMIGLLQNRLDKAPIRSRAENVFLGRRVVLPVFSRGLQGVVVGFFVNTPRVDRDSIFSTLLQFGGSLADVYADFRWTEFVEMLGRDNLSDRQLARQIINVVSPVKKVIVTRDGRSIGYKIHQEESYWGGYDLLSAVELKNISLDAGFLIAGINDTEVYIEPFSDVSEINFQFTRIRLETNLNRAMSSILLNTGNKALSMDDLDRIYAPYLLIKADEPVSTAKLRQEYVLRKIREYWDVGSVRISNVELKKYLENRLHQGVRSGYQATTYALELERVLEQRVKTSKEGNSLILTWNKE